MVNTTTFVFRYILILAALGNAGDLNNFFGKVVLASFIEIVTGAGILLDYLRAFGLIINPPYDCFRATHLV